MHARKHQPRGQGIARRLCVRMPPNGRAWRDNQTRLLTPACLDLVRVYYPPAWRAKIMPCVTAQIRGTYKHTCRDAYCPACNPAESDRIWKAQYTRLRKYTPKGAPVRLTHEVYTLPVELRHLIARPEGYAGFKEAVRQTVREIHQADVCGVMNLHPIGDENLDIFHPHWDVIVHGYRIDDGVLRKQISPYIHYDDARAIYTHNLVHHLHLAPHQVPEKINLYLDRKNGTWLTKPARTRHKVRYSARHVYQPHRAWLSEDSTGGDWYYQPDKKRSEIYAFEGRRVIENFVALESALAGRKRRVWFGSMQYRRLKLSTEGSS